MTNPTDLIARADAWIARGLYQGAKPLVPALRDALAAALTRAEAMEAERDRQYDANCDLIMRVAAVEAERDRLLEALTPSADTKAAYIAEVKTDCPSRGGPHTISWTATKDVMKMIRARAALTGEPQP